MKKSFSPIPLVKIFWVIFFIFFANLFCYAFLSREHYIYFWDWNFYHSRFVEFTLLLKQRPILAVRTLIHSIRHTEYSFIAPSLLSPLGLLFGTSRLVYILGILNLFALPAIALFCLSVKKAVNASAWHFYVVFAAIMLLAPTFWIPILTGYYDVIGILIIGLILFLYFKKNLLEQTPIDLARIALLLILLVLTRRWYGYWVVGFFAALGISELFFQEKIILKTFIKNLGKLFILGLCSLLIFVLTAKPIFLQLIQTNYYDIYSGYRLNSPFLQSLWQAASNYGIVVLALVLVGFYFSIKNSNAKRLGWFFFFHTIIACGLFARVQFFDRHHHYLFLPAIIFYLSCFIFYGHSLIKRQFIKRGFLLACLLFLAFNFILAFSYKTQRLIAPVKIFFSGARHLPLTRNDFREINSLLSFLNSLPKGKIYILASSLNLNGELIANSCQLKENQNFSVCSQIFTTYDIDKRDGFPWQFLDAEYVLTTEPLQFHINPDGQRLIGLISNQITEQKGIGKSFLRLKENFILDNGIKVKIYKKISPIDRTELNNLLKIFIELYPDQKKLFENKLF